MSILLLFCFFVLGASLGSFLSVVIHRIHTNQKGIFFGRSSCPQCKKQLTSKDLVPLFSYIFLQGKCRYCEKKLSPHYFLLELSGGLMAILLFLKFPFLNEAMGMVYWGNIASFGLFFLSTIFLLGIFFYDLQYMEIPEIFLFPFIAIALVGSLFINHFSFWNLLIALGIALVIFGGQIVVSKGKWLGIGDLYLGIAMAFLLGWQQFLIAIALTYGIGSILSIILLVSKKAHSKSKIPFAPFMVLGTFATFFFGEKILGWYMNLLNF